MVMNILALGDIVGGRGTDHLCRKGFLPSLRKEHGIHFVIANGENSAKGNGLSPDSAEALFDARLLRPANFPGAAPGNGYAVYTVEGARVLVFNLSGNAFMLEPIASPYEWADKILESEAGKYDIAILDFHAETTSEKIAMGWFLDGRVSAVFGTHTHVQTADERVLPRGTGYITDIGMCGSMNGVLGIKTECILHKFTVHTPVRFEEAEGDEHVHGAVFSVDTESGKCLSVKRISV